MKLLEFNFNSYSIRTILIDGEPWFVLKDIGAVLELSNHKQALIDLKKRLRKGGVSDEVSSTYPIKDSMGREQKVTIVSETGLYELVFASRKDIAIEFRFWVTSEVLPSIRKTGSYHIDSKPVLEKPQETDLQKFISDIEIVRKTLELKPFEMLMVDRFNPLNSPIKKMGIDLSGVLLLPTELGKVIGKSAIETNLLLFEKGYQVKVDGVWTLTEKGREFGVEVNGQFPQLKWKLQSAI